MADEATLTPAIQEYLESLYWLGEAGIERTPTNLSRAMQVSPPSVTGMVRRLESEGLVDRGPGKRIVLTDQGMEVAKHVVSRHRLVEAFLVALEARMLEMIGEARTCPHGHPIGDYPREPGVPLTAVPTASVVRILRFENEDHDLLRMFRRAGVEPRASYTIVAFGQDRAELEGPQGPTGLPLYAARTISVAVERSGDGPVAEQDPESLATAYLLGETHWSR
jgi:DtxR family transcriptional regulator, Mn-dependent transcriptional regulator